MYGNDMLDAQGRVKVNEKHHEIVMLDKILSYSRIPHITQQMFDGYQISYPKDLIGYGRKYTVRQHSLTDGNKKPLWSFGTTRRTRPSCRHTQRFWRIRSNARGDKKTSPL